MQSSPREQAQSFLEQITSNDNIALITDHDPDGFTSGTLFFDYCVSKGASITQFTFVRGISSPENFLLEEYNKIITTDLPASQIGPTLDKYPGKPTMFMDHHPKDSELSSNVIEYRTLDRGYIPSARSAYELTGGKRWLSLAGVIADVGDRYPENESFIKEILDELGLSLDQFKKRVMFPISNAILYLANDPKKAFGLIQKMKTIEDIVSIEKYSRPIEDELERIINLFEIEKEDLEGATYFYFESSQDIKARLNGFTTEKSRENEVYVFATPKNSEKISVSARNQTKRMDMAVLLRAGISGLPDSSAGGHFAASGATFRIEDLSKFKENIVHYLKKNPLL